MPRSRPRTDAARDTIALAREEVRVGKRPVQTGRVRIRKVVREREQEVQAQLLREEVDVKRVPVNRVIERPAEPHYRGDVLVIPVMEERLVTEKRLVVTEELHVRRRRIEQPHRARVMLRREEPVVERVAGKPPATERK